MPKSCPSKIRTTKNYKVQIMDPWSMDPLRGLGPCTGSIKIWTGSMDPLFLQVEVAPLNYDLMTFDDTLHDSSSFGKQSTSLIAHFPLKIMLNSSFSLLLVIFKHTG